VGGGSWSMAVEMFKGVGGRIVGRVSVVTS